ncbi:hypothetical protein O181_042167 [Austropuccinia psidii MF-1]|uniref:Uncharacterized protein n=1 Tax=Austropuccinia psidii MF-1 TaxID=1389203 RepID=A0A9Q3HFL4_9BASI|nr:hypothetical protein [Austropuccinia psidii MF-1]
MLPLLPTHLRNHLSLCFRTPTSSSLLHPHDIPSSTTHTHTSAPLPLIMLMLPPCPHDMPPTPPPHLQPCPSLCFHTAYHAQAPSGPSQYASDAATPCPPSPILML